MIGEWNEGGVGCWVVVTVANGAIYAYSSSNNTNFHEHNTAASVIPVGKPSMITVLYPASGGTPSAYLNSVSQAMSFSSGDQAYSGINAAAQPLYFGYSPKLAGTPFGINGTFE